jgi:hypothetical protein
MADRFFDPERWRYADEERYREESRRPRYGEREYERGGRLWARDAGGREYERGSEERDYGRGPGPRRSYGDERGLLDRAGDELRSWFGDEDAQRRRMMDEREDRWRDRTAERGWSGEGAHRRDRSDDVPRQWGYIDRGEWRGPDWRGQYGSGTQGTSWYGRPDAYGGQNVGRGPRGWQRSDDRIKEDVCERMTQDPRLDASDLEVRVANCEITLTGSVADREAKRLAEDIAESVSGVRDVHNQIRVTSGQDSEQSPQRGFGGERRIA